MIGVSNNFFCFHHQFNLVRRWVLTSGGSSLLSIALFPIIFIIHWALKHLLTVEILLPSICILSMRLNSIYTKLILLCYSPLLLIELSSIHIYSKNQILHINQQWLLSSIQYYSIVGGKINFKLKLNNEIFTLDICHINF
jgi:hypothetical protein